VAVERALPRTGRSAKVLVAALIIALAIPLGLTSVRAYRYQHWMRVTKQAAIQWAGDTSWKVTDVHQSGDEIVATVVGSGAPPSIDRLRTLVRQSVPANVRVRVVEDPGASAEL